MSGRIRASAFGLDRHTQTEREDAKADVDPAVVCKKHKVGLDMTKRSNFLLCCLALLAVTSGCAVQHPWTSGELSEPPPVAQYRIAFDATMPTEVYMEKMGSELQPPPPSAKAGPASIPKIATKQPEVTNFPVTIAVLHRRRGVHMSRDRIPPRAFTAVRVRAHGIQIAISL